MNRIAMLSAAATLTLTAACGDNTYVPVEVDDDSTADFERATVDVGRRAISDDYVAPSSLFSFARPDISERMQWADETDTAIPDHPAYTDYQVAHTSGAMFDGYEVAYADPRANVRPGDRAVPVAPSSDVASSGAPDIAWSDVYQTEDGAIATSAACSNVGFETAPSVRDRVGAPGEQVGYAPTTAAADGQPSALEATNGEAIDDTLTCDTPIDNSDFDDQFGDVCQCNDLSCVADFVYDAMGCGTCMTFVCGEELVGACAACAP